MTEQGASIDDAPQAIQDFGDYIVDLQDDWDDILDFKEVTDESTRTLRSNIEYFVRPMKRAVREDFDQVCVFSSHKRNGLGKSALAYWCAWHADKRNFELDRNFFFKGGLRDIKKKCDTLPKYSCVVMDEILELLYKRKAQTADLIDFNVWLGQDQRKTNQILLGCIPDFFDLDKYARGGKVSTMVEVLERGVGVIFQADSFPKTDPWHEDEFDKILKNRRRGQRENLIDKINLLEKHWCFRGPIFWTDFPPEAKNEYLKLVKHYSGYQLNDDMESKELADEYSRHKAVFAGLRAVEWLISQGFSRTSVLRRINMNESDYKKFSDLRLKHEAKIISDDKPKPQTNQNI